MADNLVTGETRLAIFAAVDALCIMAGTVRPVLATDPIYIIERKGCQAIVALKEAGIVTDAAVAALLARITAVEAVADSALQPGDNITLLNNNAGYVTESTLRWGNIVGTLAAQGDLQAALNAKQAAAPILTTFSALPNALGVLRNDGFGVLSWTAAGGVIVSDAPLSGDGTAGSHLVISLATTSTDGYLSSTDWNTFNNKQPAGSYLTALTGDATASGPGSAVLTLATVNSNVGSFGSATKASTFTVNAKGLITAAAEVTVTPAIGSVTGLGTGVATALALNVGSAGAFVTFNGAGGTPSSLTLTNGTGLPLSTGVTGDLPFANLVQASGASILAGRGSAGGAGDYQEITLGSGLTMTGTVLSAAGTGGTVTSVSFTGGLISVANPTTTPALTVAGTSGGIPYFSGASTWASSGALAANSLVIGGGAGTAPATTTTGANVLTALGVAVGSAGAFVVNGGALGTPSSGVATNLTGTAAGLTAGTVTTNANLTGNVTSVGNATTVVSIPSGATAVTQSQGDNSTKVATTAYVDAALQDFEIKTPVVAATNAVLLFSPNYANGSSGVGATLTGTSFGVLIVDGYTVALNDRVLVKNQASAFQNGVYTLTTVGTALADYVLTRSTDFNQTANILYGDTVAVLQGTVNANQQFTMNVQTAITVGTDAITFAQTSGGSQLTAGTGINITGNTIAIDSTVATLTGAQSLTNKKLGSLTTNGLVTTSGGDGTLSVTVPGTGVLTALGVNVGSAGAFITFNGAGGTPSSLVGTNITGTASGLTAGNVTTNANLTGPITSSGNATSIASQTGTGTTFVMSAAPTIAGGSITALTTLAIRDTSAAFDVTLAATSSTTITAGRTLTFDVVNAARTIKLTGNPTLNDWFDQSVKSGASPTFVTVTAALSGNATTATTLATARAIYGNNFDGSAALNQIIASTYGGTGNGFTKISGPTTSERTKTMRDASDTVLELGGSYTPTGTWTSLTMVTPVLGTPTSGNLVNCTGYVGTSALVTTGALNSGSITSGFGSIDVGADAISGGAATFTTVTGTGLITTGNALASTSNVTANAASRITVDYDSSVTAGRILGWGVDAATYGIVKIGVLSSNASLTALSVVTVTSTGLTSSALTSTGLITAANAVATTGAVSTNAASRGTLDFSTNTRLLAWGANSGTYGTLDLGVLSSDASLLALSVVRITSTGVTLSAPLPFGSGGTGLTALGGAGQVLRTNAGVTAMEWATVTGTGTVTNTGGNLTANSILLGNGAADAKVVAGIITDGTSMITLGVNTTTLGKLKMFGNTSGDATIQPAAVAGTATVITLPAATGTLATLAGTESLTNKKLGSLTTNGFVKTSAGDGTLSVDTNVYYKSGDTPTFGTTTLTALIGTYNNISTVKNGVPSILGSADVAARSTLVAATTLYTPAADGWFRINAFMKITTTGTSPVAGPITITYTSADGSVAQSHVMLLKSVTGTVVTTTVNNSTTTGTVNGNIVVYAKSGVAIQYAIAVSGTFGTGLYIARLTCEALG